MKYLLDRLSQLKRLAPLVILPVAMLDAQNALADSEWADDLRLPSGGRFETELPDADEQSSLDDEAARG